MPFGLTNTAGGLPKIDGSGVERRKATRWPFLNDIIIQNDREGYASTASGPGCVSSA